MNPIPFGKYELLERIAAGGMAEVWRARLRGEEELLAIKRILPQIAEDHSFITMLLDEARVGVQLDHPGVVQIRDLGQIDGNYFIAMEYLGGQSLRAVLERAGTEPPPVAFAAHVGMAVADALAYVHGQKDAGGRHLAIVHRDVSPDNVLVTYEGTIKLIDFGIAKTSAVQNRTQAGLVKGKLCYMSPEQSRGQPIDARSDIFSLGAVLFELLTGQRAFLGENEYATVMAVRERPIRAPSKFSDRVPPALDAVVLRSLVRELDQRYQSAADMARDLQHWIFSQTQFGADGVASYLQALFPAEREKERQVRHAFGAKTPPRVRASPSLSRERTEPGVPMPAAPPRAPLPIEAATERTAPGLPERVAPPPGKRANSLRAMFIPVLEATNVLRRSATRPPQRMAVVAPAAHGGEEPVAEQSGAPAGHNPLPWLLAAVAAGLGLALLAAPRLVHGQAQGFLVINASPPNSVVFVDGARQVDTPPLVLEVAPGVHGVSVEAAGFAALQEQVTVAPGEQKTIDANLAVASEPARH